MKTNLPELLFATTGTVVLGNSLLTESAYADSWFLGNGHLDATDFLPTGSVKSEPLTNDHPSIYGLLRMVCSRPGMYA